MPKFLKPRRLLRGFILWGDLTYITLLIFLKKPKKQQNYQSIPQNEAQAGLYLYFLQLMK